MKKALLTLSILFLFAGCTTSSDYGDGYDNEKFQEKIKSLIKGINSEIAPKYKVHCATFTMRNAIDCTKRYRIDVIYNLKSWDEVAKNFILRAGRLQRNYGITEEIEVTVRGDDIGVIWKCKGDARKQECVER